MSTKVAVLETSDVAVSEVEFSARRAIQEKYSVDAVPLLVVADAEGVVRAHIFGNVPASDVWAAVSRARDERADGPGPGAAPPSRAGDVDGG